MICIMIKITPLAFALLTMQFFLKDGGGNRCEISGQALPHHLATGSFCEQADVAC